MLVLLGSALAMMTMPDVQRNAEPRPHGFCAMLVSLPPTNNVAFCGSEYTRLSGTVCWRSHVRRTFRDYSSYIAGSRVSKSTAASQGTLATHGALFIDRSSARTAGRRADVYSAPRLAR
ncbi:hypothetical protein KCP74_23020 [Salmonella enterica subsp. enterica]|nr:hypothetical protein KCP74_23020 [Salmonella enterica subsp. enterica]